MDHPEEEMILQFQFKQGTSRVQQEQCLRLRVITFVPLDNTSLNLVYADVARIVTNVLAMVLIVSVTAKRTDLQMGK
jgi:hypothetical protein